MRRGVFFGLLVAEAIVCIVFAAAKASFAGAFTAAMAFPFEQIGMGLRALSLSGGPGNAIAIGIYCLLSLLPIAALPMLRKRRALCPEDGMLILLSALLFAVLYIMVNPGLINPLIGGESGTAMVKAIFGIAAYSVVCGYFVLRALRLFRKGGVNALERYMSIMLGVLGAIFVYAAFGDGFSGLLNSISALREGNVGNEHLLGASYFFLGMQFVVEALTYMLDVWVIAAALRLLEELRKDRYSAETVAAADRISKRCTMSLTVAVLSSMGFNLLQLLFINALRTVSVSVNIPILSIIFVLAVLLLTRFIAENKQLREENDTFI